MEIAGNYFAQAVLFTQPDTFDFQLFLDVATYVEIHNKDRQTDPQNKGSNNECRLLVERRLDNKGVSQRHGIPPAPVVGGKNIQHIVARREVPIGYLALG